MDVSQVINLSNWYTNYHPALIGAYNELSRVLEHNATRPNKEPVREHLDNLIKLLESTSLDELTNEELNKLDELNILQYLGQSGIKFTTDTITKGEYDPASVSEDFKQAIQTLNSHNKPFIDLKNTLTQLKFEDKYSEEFDDQTMVRIRFQNDAAITDIVLLKKWSTDWYAIMRGVALCVGEKPNDVRVVSASNGSLILTLVATASITLVLAKIVQNIGKITYTILQIANTIEDLRHKKFLNKIVEDDLKRQQLEIKEQGITDTFAIVREGLKGRISKDSEAALKKSIEKYLDFNDKGGDVDFISPKNLEEHIVAEEDVDELLLEGIPAEIRLLQETTSNIRNTQSEIRRLSDLRNDTEE